MVETNGLGGDRNGSAAATAARQIVIVEDDPMTLAGWIELLGAAGYAVTGTTTFEAGRDALRSAPDLLIADVRLGAFNGLQLIMRARSWSVEIPVIVITGFPDDVIKEEAERLGAMYLEKPVDPALLLAAVAEALERGRRLEPELATAAATQTSTVHADDRDRRRWAQPGGDDDAPPARAAPPSQQPVAWEQMTIDDGDVIVVREPAGVDRPVLELTPSPSASQFRLSVRGHDEHRPRVFATYERAIIAGEALAAEQRVRLFYVETGVLILLKDHRPAAKA